MSSLLDSPTTISGRSPSTGTQAQSGRILLGILGEAYAFEVMGLLFGPRPRGARSRSPDRSRYLVSDRRRKHWLTDRSESADDNRHPISSVDGLRWLTLSHVACLHRGSKT
ncbi:hypothetical protein C8039_20110 [Halogeometricum sp. wsp3]|nr:hypothetical protein C8039_20110 [Halogeometricum sp. wsp3]